MSPSPSLSIVDTEEQKPQAVGERIRRLITEAKGLAQSHVNELVHMMMNLVEVAAEITEGGEAYPPGIRDECARLIETLESRIQTITAIKARTMS